MLARLALAWFVAGCGAHNVQPVLANREASVGEPSGTITGKIASETDELAGVTVVASRGGQEAVAISDDHGAYTIGELMPGDYVVTFYYADRTVAGRRARVFARAVTRVSQRFALSSDGSAGASGREGARVHGDRRVQFFVDEAVSPVPPAPPSIDAPTHVAVEVPTPAPAKPVDSCPVSATGNAIHGQIVDRHGDALPGVTVIVTSPALPQTQQAISNEQGCFEVRELPPGVYMLTFYYEDTTVEEDDVVVFNHQISVVDLTLRDHGDRYQWQPRYVTP